MAEKIKLEVVTPEKSLISEDAQIVMAPGELGEFGVLPSHTPFLTTLKTGSMKYIDANGNERYAFVSGGFAETLPDRVTVLAETAEKRSEIDLKRATAAKERAEKRLAEDRARDDIDFSRAKAAFERAVHRIKLAETR